MPIPPERKLVKAGNPEQLADVSAQLVNIHALLVIFNLFRAPTRMPKPVFDIGKPVAVYGNVAFLRQPYRTVLF